MEHDNQDPKGSLDTMNGDQDTPKDEERQNSSGDATKDSSGPSKSALANAQSLVDRGLEFLANASNGTLGACLVGLGATTYLVLGRFGLLLIGVVGGVALHAAWEVPAARAGDRAIKTRGNERGLDIVERLLICREHQKAEESEEDDDADANTSATTVGKRVMDYSAFSPSTSAALTELTDALIRNYVEWWYTPILSTERLFPRSCRQTLVGFILRISSHLSRKRPADTLLDFLTNSSSIMIVFLNELSTAFSEGPAEAKLPAEAIAEYLERYPESNLANILDTKHQSKKLRLVAEDILQSFLDPKVWECDPTRVFLREILAGVVLEMTVQSCSEPEWINGWIVYLLEEGEPELINAIDAGVGGTSGHELENVKRQAAADEESAKLAPEPKEPVIASEKGHQRQPSKIEDPMEEAMLEAKRLSEMIAEEDAKRDRERRKSQAISVDDASESTTQGTSTPTSSQSERNGDHAVRYSPQASSSDLSRSNSSTTHHASASVSLARNTPSFTSFDQLEAQSAPKLSPILSPPASAPASPTLHNANISIIDDSAPGDRATLRAKPVVDYLVQIEPASTQYPGWMIARKYADFETLHEVMRRISVVSGVTGFTEHHSTLPQWRGHTKPILRAELEKYLSDALHYRQLAESEGMRRFLEKDQGLQASPNASAKGFPGIGWPNPAAFETMGKGMLDVLSSAPKGAADGGKALFGGVTGVLGVGSLTQKKQAPSPHPNGSNKTAQASNSSLTSAERRSSVASGYQKGRESMESSRSSFVAKSQLKTAPAMDHRPSSSRGSEAETQPRTSISSRSSVPARSVQTMDLEQELHLPPPPSDIPDDYDGEDDFQKSLSSIDTSASRASFEVPSAAFQCPSRATTISSLRSIPNQSLPEREARAASAAPVAPVVASATPPAPKSPPAPTSPPASPTPELPAAPIKTPLEAAPPPTRKAAKPLTERETQVAVELLFAIINELYTLSSAWNIRRTLLTAAKTFLLRPGNPNLESIRVLLQDSVLDAHTSDDGLAALIRKVRLNALPSEEEQAQFPAPLSDDEKERLRLKARKLLVERALPQALTSVMGAAASGEALGRVFDCLQTRYVARGLMFGLLLQAVRAMTQ